MVLPSLRQRIDQLIASPSVSCTRPDLDMSNRGVIDLLEGWFSHLGFRTEVVEVAPAKYNLIATLGQGEGGLVFSGHTDTVPCNEEKWQSNPFAIEERDNKLYGLGSCDMKGFFSVVLEAVLPFAEHPEKLKEPLIILATADEECSMIGARALAESGRLKARKAIIGEPTNLRPIYQHKGIMMNGLRIIGQAGHSSNPALGNNAMEAMHSVMSELLGYRQDLQARYKNADFQVQVPTLNFGCIHGGDNPNRICGECELEFDLRALPGMDNDELFAQMEQRLAPVAERHQVKLEFFPLFPHIPAFANQREMELVQRCEQLTGSAAESVAFATEGPFLQRMGMETIILGPGSIDQAHQPDEFLALDQIRPAVNLLQSLIRHYCLKQDT
ncbi:acetylornithine deacetylase [Pokkaliibacter sp. CJK22405]|uniref:acetylornithine deacetylase n=1 Tax=Pokkaliibacter sp. CJK22405 TaxID=3384615 RepID=UPI003984EDD7